MRTSTTKYTTGAGLCAMALVLAAALVLAGCEGEGVSTQGGPRVLDWRDRLDENTIRQISELKNKPAGTYEVKVTGTIKMYSDLSDCMNAQELPANVLVHLDLSGISSMSSDTIGNDIAWDSGFENCRNLAKVTLPSIVTTIGSSAFSGCTNLVEIPGLENFTSIGNWAFAGCTSLTSISIPASVTSIGGSAFSGCKALTTVTLPQGLESLVGTFSDCTSLEEITLPNSVNTISGAFNGCTRLKRVLAIGDVITSGGEGITQRAFYGCSSLAEVTIPKSVGKIDGSFSTIYAKAGESLAKVTLQEGIKTIGNDAFYGNKKLTEITIPASVTSIGQSAFSSCTNLTSVTFKDTTGWRKKKDYQSIDVSDPNTNAKTLKVFAGQWFEGIYK